MKDAKGHGSNPRGAAHQHGSDAHSAGVGRVGVAPLDHDGNPLVDMNGTPMVMNPDGTVTLYHRTPTPEAAAALRATGRFVSKENTNETFFSNMRDGGQAEGYGEHVVAVRVEPSKTRINDAFRNGEIHVAVSNRHLSRKNIVP